MTAESAPGRRHLLVIFNPTAGRGARRKLRLALQALDRLGAAATVQETTAPGDAETFAAVASSARVDDLAVAGGDGTINEVVNGMTDWRLPLAVFPVGTANVLAQELELPMKPARFAEVAVTGPAVEASLGEVLFS